MSRYGRMFTTGVGVIVSGVGMLLFARLARADTITMINVPGAVATEPNGINDAGQVVGDYTDTSGNVHGFSLKSGVLS
jgi:probable HAF family extracellular repeat protein